jgi:hypothetical protein
VAAALWLVEGPTPPIKMMGFALGPFVLGEVNEGGAGVQPLLGHGQSLRKRQLDQTATT